MKQPTVVSIAISIATVLLFSGVDLQAKKSGRYTVNYPNGLVVDSVDPSADSAAFLDVRSRMAHIRKTERRPTVALVLCGGGAKGASEVGALKLIEELEIPVDLICGTSIGGLVGGLYSVGYSAQFLDSLMTHQDWGKLLSDKIDKQYVPLYLKKVSSKYQLLIPFHYARTEVNASGENMEFEEKKTKRLSGKDADNNLTTQAGVSTIASSLPSGYVYGLNVNNLFSSLTVGYQDSISFSTLPIPFCCVATDIVSCKALNQTSGYLKGAMRSTMSIPGLFSPVRRDGMVLADGGMRNNFPVDIARAMGADIVIGIDLSDSYARYEDVNNAGTVASQLISMLGRQSYEQTVGDVDVYIKPDLTGYNMLSFKSQAIDTMIARGYGAALKHIDELKAVKARMRGARTVYRNTPAVDINRRKVCISGVSIEGMTKSDAKVLYKKIKMEEVDSVDASDMERAIAVIQGTGAVSSVTYSLLGHEEPYELVFHCVQAPTHQVGVGVRMDSDIWAEIGVNLGLNTRRLAGPKLDVNALIGKSQTLDVKFLWDNPGFPTLNLEGMLSNKNFTTLRIKDYNETVTTRLEAGYLMHQERLFISANKWTEFDGQFGFKNTGYLANTDRIATSIYAKSADQQTGNYSGLFLKGNFYNMDDRYFPNRGVDAKISLDGDFFKSAQPGFKPIYSVGIDVKGVIPMGSDRVKLIPDFHWRNIFNSYPHNVEVFVDESGKEQYYYSPLFSAMHHNFLGSRIEGKYAENQVPFFGINSVSVCESNGVFYDHLVTLAFDLRVSVIKNLYLSALGGYAHMAATLPDFFTYKNHKDIFAAGVQASYNTIVGPISVDFHWANRTGSFIDDWGFHISAGFDF